MTRVLALLCLLTAPAWAQPAKSRALKKAADQAFVEGDLNKSLELLEQAYAADPDPGLIANQGVVLEKLGDYGRAVAAFERFLETRPDAAKARKAREMRDRLKPSVRVESDPPGVRVQLIGDAEPLGLTPLDTRLVVGKYEFELSRPGYRPWRGRLEVTPGRAAMLRGALEKARPTGAPADPAVTAPVRLAPPPTRDHLLWGGIAAGTGVAVVGVGAYLLSLASDEVDARDAASSRASWDDHQASAESYNLGGWISVGLGAAVIAGGALVMVLGGEGGGVTVGPSGAGAWVEF